MKKFSIVLGALALTVAASASAHVRVSPEEVGIGAFQTFTVSVPVEKDLPTTGLRLVMPAGLEHVTPTVKPGWNIRTVEQAGTGAPSADGHTDGIVTEIIWTGGRIPQHFRDDFTFSAKVPATETDLVWKAYQTYSDGSVVAWDAAPGAENPNGAGPASLTLVIDDLSDSDDEKDEGEESAGVPADTATWTSIAALVVAAFSAYLAKKK